MILHREEAVSIILKFDVSMLSKDERESMLWNCWGVEADDPEFKLFSESLQQEMLNEEEPIYDVLDERYDLLLYYSLKDSYCGVKNEYLSKLASEILREKVVVEGTPEKLFACPCCKYETLKDRGSYDICPMCFWEDDGSNDTLRYSAPNHMTLAEGKSNYAKFGAVREEAVQWVNSGSDQIYFKSID